MSWKIIDILHCVQYTVQLIKVKPIDNMIQKPLNQKLVIYDNQERNSETIIKSIE